MHYHAEIWLPNDTDYENQVAEIMSVYNEHDHEDGWWDWYQIGGRWTGVHAPMYEPEKDPKNIEKCKYCDGSGKRDWRAEGVKPCNGCASFDENGVIHYPHGIGRALKWPTGWAMFPLDLCPVDAAPDDLTACTLIAGANCWKDTEYFHDREYPDCFQDTPFKGAHVKGWLKAKLDISHGYLVTVDYHS